MKSINYALLVALSSFMLTACGGGSASGPVKEASANDVGTLIETPVDQGDIDITEEVLGDIGNTEYKPKVANWYPPEIDDDAIDGDTNSKISKINYNPSVFNVSQKVISTGDDTNGWITYDRTPAGATITSVDDDERGGKVLKLTGDGLKNGHVIGYSYSRGSTWNDTENKTIKWSMKYSKDFMIYVRVTTEHGYRYLFYTDSNKNYGEVGYMRPHYIHNGLGATSNDGSWRTFTRNLSADLKRHQPMNKIISVDGFFVRGSGLIDDVELLKPTPTQMDQVIYEDAEDGNNTRWNNYTHNGGIITNVNDTDKASKVIEVKGNGLKTGYMLGAWKNENRWKNTTNNEISWDMKYSENYVVFISVETEHGHRFITYIPMSTTTCNKFRETGELATGGSFGKRDEGGYTYITLGLCPDTKNGTWQTIARDLKHDLQKYEPSNSLKSVNAFLIRGSGRVDNIKMFDTNTVEHPDLDTSS